MQQVNEIIPRAVANGSQQQSQQKEFQPSEQEARDMHELFSALSAEYPFFLPKHEDDVVNKLAMWIKLLKPYDMIARKKALESCLKHHKKVGGPSVAEFIELLRTRPEHQDFERLPAPPADESLAEKALANLRAITGARKR